MVPIHRNYFVSDLAVAIKVPVLAVAYNRIGYLNHAVLYCAKYSRTRIALSLRLVLNNAHEMGDIAAQTNADILRKILDSSDTCRTRGKPYRITCDGDLG